MWRWWRCPGEGMMKLEMSRRRHEKSLMIGLTSTKSFLKLCGNTVRCKSSKIQKPIMTNELTYSDAISLLNSLQSNEAARKSIEKSLKEQKSGTSDPQSLSKNSVILKYLARTGINAEHLKQLSVIHVTGSKGKGTTSALCESILRSHGYHTGFYSSPHLVSVRERIRLNGVSMDEAHFARSFQQVYWDLYNKKEYPEDMPMYFCFLTVVAFKVFLEEKVDVAVVEVGIGGHYDFTNCVSKVPVVGFTPISLEHTAILGDTIEQIARDKGGIMKPGCAAYTTAQTSRAMAVLNEVARDKNVPLILIPDFDTYEWKTRVKLVSSADLPSNKMNASLAIQMAHAWIKQHNLKSTNSDSCKVIPDEKNNFKNGNLNIEETIKTDCNKNEKITDFECLKCLPEKTAKGLAVCCWPGRCQILKEENVDLYIDGAHTLESMDVCVNWFKKNTSDSSFRILMFNMTGDRDVEPIMKILMDLKFAFVIFVPNVSFSSKTHLDNQTLMNPSIEKISENQKVWSRLESSMEHDPQMSRHKSVLLSFDSISNAINKINLLCQGETRRPQVLVTGSLHLVGNTLAVIDPDLIKSNNYFLFS